MRIFPFKEHLIRRGFGRIKFCIVSSDLIWRNQIISKLFCDEIFENNDVVRSRYPSLSWFKPFKILQICFQWGSNFYLDLIWQYWKDFHS